MEQTLIVHASIYDSLCRVTGLCKVWYKIYWSWEVLQHRQQRVTMFSRFLSVRSCLRLGSIRMACCLVKYNLHIQTQRSPVTCSHLQPLGSHLQPLGNHLQPLGSHLQPLGSHLQPKSSQAASSAKSLEIAQSSSCKNRGEH